MNLCRREETEEIGRVLQENLAFPGQMNDKPRHRG
jgi:hypothetical protein